MRRRCATALAVLAAAAVGGCGAEDFPNEPRPAALAELTAKVDDNKVVVAPDEVGAGLAQITISNQSREDVRLNLTGPSDHKTNPIDAGGVASFRVELDEGNYRLEPDVTTISPGTLTVGRRRASAQNELLLP